MANGPIKEGIRAIQAAVVIEGIKWVFVWCMPWVLVVITFMSGYFQQIPLIATISAATFVFAASTTGLLRYDEWRSRHSAENKLILINVTLGLDYERDNETGKPIALEKAQIIINLQNISSFPISYIVDDIRSSIWGNINPNPVYPTRAGIIGPLTSAGFRDDTIDMRSANLKQVIEGRADFTIRYGRKGYEKYRIEKHLILTGQREYSSNTYLQTATSEAPR